MPQDRVFNVYCDESCHLENDGMPIMVWGGIICEAQHAREIAIQIRAIKNKHGLSKDFEAKWTKVSPSKIEFYDELLEYFIENTKLRFRGLVVPDKSMIDHVSRNQTHADWYYKMYYVMLKYIISPPNHYRVFLDIKDTIGGPKIERLHFFLAHQIQDINRQYIEVVQQVRSNEVELLQIADLVIGAIQYSNRNLATSTAKQSLVTKLKTHRSLRSLNSTSSFGSTKFNILVWNSNEDRA
jgi:hypothetical protein